MIITKHANTLMQRNHALAGQRFVTSAAVVRTLTKVGNMNLITCSALVVDGTGIRIIKGEEENEKNHPQDRR